MTIQTKSNSNSKARTALTAFLLVATAIPAGGCRICAECNDLDYPAYGGAWQRTRRDAGRVGSVFDPAGAKAADLVARDEPERPDQRERRRQTEAGVISPFRRDREESDTGNADPVESDDADQLRERSEELRNRSLDDIQIEGEENLRNKGIDDIEINVVPGQPAPPAVL